MLAYQHPEIWPVLNEASIQGALGSSTDWVSALEAIRLILRPR